MRVFRFWSGSWRRHTLSPWLAGNLTWLGFGLFSSKISGWHGTAIEQRPKRGAHSELYFCSKKCVSPEKDCYAIPDGNYRLIPFNWPRPPKYLFQLCQEQNKFDLTLWQKSCRVSFGLWRRPKCKWCRHWEVGVGSHNASQSPSDRELAPRLAPLWPRKNKLSRVMLKTHDFSHTQYFWRETAQFSSKKTAMIIWSQGTHFCPLNSSCCSNQGYSIEFKKRIFSLSMLPRTFLRQSWVVKSA